jgi:ABC-type multidrug transport system fused ATPase/permease subunit
MSKSTLKYIPRVLRYLGPYWKLAVISWSLLFLSTLIAVLEPWPFALLLDSVLAGKDGKPLPAILDPVWDWLGRDPFTLLIALVVAGFSIHLLLHLIGVINSYVSTKLEQNMSLDFRSDMFKHLQRLSLAYHERRRAGMTMYITNFADAPAHLVGTIPALVESIVMLGLMFAITYALDWQLALLTLTVVPILYLSVGYYVKHIQEPLFHVKAMEGGALAMIHEAISMLRVIIAFGREDHEHRRWRAQAKRAVDGRVKITVKQTLFTMVVDSTTAAGTFLVLGFGAYQVLMGNGLTVGQLAVIMMYLAKIYHPLETISTTIGTLQDTFVNMKFAYGIMDAEVDIKDAPDAVAVDRVQGHVGFHGVNFSYEGRVDTLKDINFEVQAGQIIAIVGPTGAGKTTLVSLLPRFYDLQAGSILLDGKDIRKFTLQSLRQQISIVLQEPLLFSGTIAENIHYGRLNASVEEIIEAAKAANAHDFIMALPEQYETELGERGTHLSGGERQRISVARAFLKNAPILILDEPTSSIDSKTEAVILDALDRLMVGRTTLMIAHRLSTIRNADRILVLDQGQLVEHGPHDELMQRDGLYKQMQEVQARKARRRSRRVADSYLDNGQEEQA